MCSWLGAFHSTVWKVCRKVNRHLILAMWQQERNARDNANLTYLRAAKTRIVESDVSSSLNLQIFVYYNSIYAIMVFVILMGAAFYK
jgi:hypothetical protein